MRSRAPENTPRSGWDVTFGPAHERVARGMGRWLPTLDTATADAERLYRRMGWNCAGVIPRYALNPDRTFTDTTLYWKRLKSQ